LYFDFYTNDSDDLEIWLTHLSSIAIMSDIENDFSILNEIGRGSYATVYLAKSLEDD
jgi:hypothetical protein